MSLTIKDGFMPDLCALHSCDNPPCCNPTHLRWGTISENTREAFERNHEYRERHVAFSKANAAIFGKINGAKNRKLLPSQVDYIKMLLAAGYIQRVIAAWYGVQQMTISNINRGVYCPKNGA